MKRNLRSRNDFQFFCRYLLFSMILIAIAVTLTTIILNLHYRKPSTHRMPGWVRRIFIQKLPRILFMRVPIQVIKDSMRSRRSKFLRQSDPALQTLSGNTGKLLLTIFSQWSFGPCHVGFFFFLHKWRLFDKSRQYNTKIWVI